MNMQKLGIVSPAVCLCCDTINISKYKELKLIRYTLCEVRKAWESTAIHSLIK